MRAVYDLVDLQPVILAARQLAYQDQTLEAYLPAVEVEDIDYRLGRINRNDQTVPPRALDTPAIPIARQGLREVRGGLPAFSAIDTLTETDLFRARRLAGLPVDLQLSATTVAARTTLTIRNSVELLRGQALMTGTLSLNSNGVIESLDYGLPTTNKVAPATAWTDVNATALSDLLAWRDAYIGNAGGPPGLIFTSTRLRRLILANKQIIGAAYGTLQGRTYAAPADVDNLFAGLGLPNIRTFDRALGVTQADGTVSLTRITPENRLAFLPADGQPIGRTEYGITQEAVELVGAGVLEQDQAPGIAVVTYIEDNPVQKSVASAALAIPVIGDPYQLLVAACY
jgi:hypothetical protein